jgi:hypothetical protein
MGSGALERHRIGVDLFNVCSNSCETSDNASVKIDDQSQLGNGVWLRRRLSATGSTRGTWAKARFARHWWCLGDSTSRINALRRALRAMVKSSCPRPSNMSLELHARRRGDRVKLRSAIAGLGRDAAPQLSRSSARERRLMVQNDPNRADHSDTQSGDRTCIWRLLRVVEFTGIRPINS